MPLSRYIPTSAIAKPGVCTSSTRPASPYEGQVIYETDTDKTLVWNGSSWVYLSTSTANPVGLESISETVIPNAASVTISNCFTSAYDAYKIILQGVKHATTETGVNMQYRAGSTTETGSVYYDARQTIPWATGTVATGATNGGTSHVPGITIATTGVLGAEIFISNPKSSATTTFFCQGMDGRASGGGARYAAGICNTTTSYDSIVFTAQTGSFAANGSICVYGYRKG